MGKHRRKRQADHIGNRLNERMEAGTCRSSGEKRSQDSGREEGESKRFKVQWSWLGSEEWARSCSAEVASVASRRHTLHAG